MRTRLRRRASKHTATTGSAQASGHASLARPRRNFPIVGCTFARDPVWKVHPKIGRQGLRVRFIAGPKLGQFRVDKSLGPKWGLRIGNGGAETRKILGRQPVGWRRPRPRPKERGGMHQGMPSGREGEPCLALEVILRTEYRQSAHIDHGG